MSLLGLVAEHHGPRGAILVLALVALIPMALSTALREPDDRTPKPTKTANST
jgi:FSR family fosmidomycin resistance protein-like MFS transporter